MTLAVFVATGEAGRKQVLAHLTDEGVRAQEGTPARVPRGAKTPRLALNCGEKRVWSRADPAVLLPGPLPEVAPSQGALASTPSLVISTIPSDNLQAPIHVLKKQIKKETVRPKLIVWS